MGWQEAIKQDKDSYDHVVNLAREAIKELENRHFIKDKMWSPSLTHRTKWAERDLLASLVSRLIRSIRISRQLPFRHRATAADAAVAIVDFCPFLWRQLLIPSTVS